MKTHAVLKLGLLLATLGLFVAVSKSGSQEVDPVPELEIFDATQFTHAHVFIEVANKSAREVEFKKHHEHCTEDMPDTFKVAPNGGKAQIEFKFKFRDRGLDDCYASHHEAEYKDESDHRNRIKIRQHASSNNRNCLDYQYFAFFWINQALCAETRGDLSVPSIPFVMEGNVMTFHYTVDK